MVSRAEARRRLTTPRGSLYIRLGDIDASPSFSYGAARD